MTEKICPRCRVEARAVQPSGRAGPYCRECACKKAAEVYRMPGVKAQMFAGHDKWVIANPEKILLHSARKRAKEKGLEFNIELSDIHIPALCPVFNRPFEKGTRQKHDRAATLDRIDPNKGYVKGNIIVVSWRANNLKRDATLEELIALVDFYKGLK